MATNEEIPVNDQKPGRYFKKISFWKMYYHDKQDTITPEIKP